jgi:hypothetical protein
MGACVSGNTSKSHKDPTAGQKEKTIPNNPLPKAEQSPLEYRIYGLEK